MSETTTAHADDLIALGDFYREFPGIPLHGVRYAIESRGILPARRVGIVRLWTRADIRRVREALEDIAKNPGRGRPVKHSAATRSE